MGQCKPGFATSLDYVNGETAAATFRLRYCSLGIFPTN